MTQANPHRGPVSSLSPAGFEALACIVASRVRGRRRPPRPHRPARPRPGRRDLHRRHGPFHGCGGARRRGPSRQKTRTAVAGDVYENPAAKVCGHGRPPARRMSDAPPSHPAPGSPHRARQGEVASRAGKGCGVRRHARLGRQRDGRERHRGARPADAVPDLRRREPREPARPAGPVGHGLAAPSAGEPLAGRLPAHAHLPGDVRHAGPGLYAGNEGFPPPGRQPCVRML